MAFSEENYFALYHELVKKGALDLLDIELFANPLAADTLIHEAKRRGLKLFSVITTFRKHRRKRRLSRGYAKCKCVRRIFVK